MLFAIYTQSPSQPSSNYYTKSCIPFDLDFLLGNHTKVIVNQYYYRGDKGTNIGTLEKDELEQLYSAQIIIDSTMIIEVGSDNWERYDAVFPNVAAPQAETPWTPPELTVAKVALPQLPPLSAPRSGHCPMCSKNLDVIGDAFADELLACPYCNTEAPAKEFIGSNEITTHGHPAPTGVPNGEAVWTTAQNDVSLKPSSIKQEGATDHGSLQPKDIPYCKAKASDQANQLLEIAKAQKKVLWCILWCIPLTLLSPAFPFVFLIILPFQIYYIYKLAQSLGEDSPVSLCIVMLIPVMSTIFLLIISQKATTCLKGAGFKVGLMGANLDEVRRMTEMVKLKDNSSSERY